MRRERLLTELVMLGHALATRSCCMVLRMHLRMFLGLRPQCARYHVRVEHYRTLHRASSTRLIPTYSKMRSLLLTVALTVLSASQLAAQCTTAWLPGGGIPGVDGKIHATAWWDADGAGPAAPLLVVAGDFRVAGVVPANRIASYDPASGEWSTFGSGMDDEVRALVVTPGGELIAAGQFASAGGVAANRIARWTGSAWAPLGSGIFGVVNTMTTLSNGDLVAGGQFSSAGGSPTSHVARWDGNAWFALAQGVDQEVRALSVLANGELVAGGNFTSAGGVVAAGLARWNGTSWAALGGGLSHAFYPVAVHALQTMSNGQLVVGGLFDSAGASAANGVARWDGNNWFAVGLGPNTIPSAFAELPNGDLVVSGFVEVPGHLATVSIARWTNMQFWSVLAAEPNNVASLLALPGGELVAAGEFQILGGSLASSVAISNTVNWNALGTGSNGAVLTSKVLSCRSALASPVSCMQSRRCPMAIWSLVAGSMQRVACRSAGLRAGTAPPGARWRASPMGSRRTWQKSTRWPPCRTAISLREGPSAKLVVSPPATWRFGTALPGPRSPVARMAGSRRWR